MYDKEQLRQAADCRQVANYIGMRVSGKYCECASGLHTESQLNHCAIYQDKTYCFTCGTCRDVFGMVSDYYRNILGSPITFEEACGIVGDACGGRELYKTSGNVETRKEEMMPFTKEDLEILGLNPAGTSTTGNMQSVFRQDREIYFQIIREKAAEEKEKISTLQSLLGKSGSEARISAALEERYQKINAIYKKAGGTEKKARPLYHL